MGVIIGPTVIIGASIVGIDPVTIVGDGDIMGAVMGIETAEAAGSGVGTQPPVPAVMTGPEVTVMVGDIAIIGIGPADIMGAEGFIIIAERVGAPRDDPSASSRIRDCTSGWAHRDASDR